jgi:hypothetical protein
MPATKDIAFPALPERDEEPWIRDMSPQDRKQWETRRETDIVTNQAAFILRIEELPGFENVSRESVEHLALRWAMVVSNIYERGYQDGINVLDEENRARRQNTLRSQVLSHEAMPGY